MLQGQTYLLPAFRSPHLGPSATAKVSDILDHAANDKSDCGDGCTSEYAYEFIVLQKRTSSSLYLCGDQLPALVAREHFDDEHGHDDEDLSLAAVEVGTKRVFGPVLMRQQLSENRKAGIFLTS